MTDHDGATVRATDTTDAAGPSQDQVMERITGAVMTHREGKSEQAREALAEIWAEIGPDGDVFHRCVLAHYMADLQDDPQEELRWDLRALEAADSLTDECAQIYHASLAVRGFYPSLHLNLGEDYRKIGDLTKAREHLAKAEACLDALPDDDYGNVIRAGITGLTTRLT